MVLIRPPPPITTQNNVDMSQSVQFIPLAPAVNFYPYADPDVYKFNSKFNASNTALSAVPTIQPIIDGTMSTTKETYNASNLENWTLMNYAQAPYGNARGQLSLITDLGLNKPGKLLEVNNNDMFKQVSADERRVIIPVPTR